MCSCGPSVTLLGQALTNLFQDNIKNTLTKFTPFLLTLHTTLIQHCVPLLHGFSWKSVSSFCSRLPPKTKTTSLWHQVEIKKLSFLRPLPCSPSFYLQMVSTLLLLIQSGPFSPGLYTKLFIMCALPGPKDRIELQLRAVATPLSSQS